LLNWATPNGTHTSIHPEAIVAKLLLIQILPLAIAIAVASVFPKSAGPLKAIFTIAFVIALAGIVVIAGPRVYNALVQVAGTKTMLVALLTTLLGMATGFALGGRDREARRTLGLASALRNPGLASTLAAAYFPQSQLAVLSALAYFFVQVVTANVVGAIVRRFDTPAGPAGNSPAI
jgi:BASS family bile acid:Na+ symporter